MGREVHLSLKLSGGEGDLSKFHTWQTKLTLCNEDVNIFDK